MAEKIVKKAQHVGNRKHNSVERFLSRLLEQLVKGQRFTYFALTGFSIIFGSVIFLFSYKNTSEESGYLWFFLIVFIFFAVTVVISLRRKYSTCRKRCRDKSTAKHKKYSLPGLLISIFLGISTPVLQKLFDIGFRDLPPDEVSQVVKEAVVSNTHGAEICKTPPKEISPEIIISALEDKKLKLDDSHKESLEKYLDSFKEYFKGPYSSEEEPQAKSDILVDMTRGACVNGNPLEAFFGINTPLGFLSFSNLTLLALLTLLMMVIVMIHFHSRHPWNVLQHFSARTMVCVFIPVVILFPLSFFISPTLELTDDLQLLVIFIAASITSISAFYLADDLDGLVKREKRQKRIDPLRRKAAKSLKRRGKNVSKKKVPCNKVPESKGMFT